jgi:GT2 family glycosyltransferase
MLGRSVYVQGVSDALPKVSVVIPNFNGVTPREGLVYLEMVKGSLAEQEFRDFDVTVADDASADDSLAWLAANWPEANVVPLERNSGFAACANAGIAASRGEYIALMNADLELSPEWLGALAAELDRDPALGFVTAKVLAHGDRGLVEQAGQDWYTCGRFSPRGLDEPDEGQFEERRRVPIGTAAAILYRRSAVEGAGGFDEDYFIYCEDADLCLRMTLGGNGGVYVPGPQTFHVRGQTTGRESDLVRFHLLRNGWLTLLKDMPASILLRSLPKIALYDYNQFNHARASGHLRTFFRAYGSFLRMLPATLRKRWRVQRSREISPREFEELLISEFPLQSGLVSAWRRLRGRAA